MSSPLWAVLPGSIDDPAAPSGGNGYDRVVLNLLSGAASPESAKNAFPTRPVYEIAVDGAWPAPAEPAREALARALSDIPDKSDVLLDGLVACGVPEILAPHKKRLRLLVLVHLPLSDETGLSPAQAADLRKRERTTLRLAATVIATSEAAARHLSEMHDLSSKPEVIPPGVAPAAATDPDKFGKRLLCVAAVTPRKGQDLLVKALEEHLADLSWSCTFAGRVAREIPHTSPDIHFTGALHGTALESAYGKCDLFVLPSRNETYGMVVTEALARGIPVLATAVGGVPEALGRAPDGTRPGLLIPPGDVTSLAAALRAWLTDPDLRHRLRAAARQRRETLPTWDETARRLSEVLDR
ncbi:glycosyltransferase family 4 protein [Paractinoplanes globisporus]|uniref:Glycosyltransferase family 4 protein n=1 Tax=Paractinoplanes globisporus TaxID=113565 RepID=A0ABW6WW38_9ACTN|nr:glycosyltransferase family 4 protein [Actinoplanes globisporus]